MQTRINFTRKIKDQRSKKFKITKKIDQSNRWPKLCLFTFQDSEGKVHFCRNSEEGNQNETLEER